MFVSPHDNNKNALVDLYIFPHAGANIHCYYEFCRNLDSTIKPNILQLPGRGISDSKELILDMRSLISKILNAIKHELIKPYMFFGHSLGGIISFALYNEIRINSLRVPDVLLISGVDDPESFSDNHLETTEMTDDEIVAYLMELGSDNKVIFSDKQMCDLFMPIIRADFQLAQSYNYVPEKNNLIDGKTQLVYFYSADDEKVSSHSIKGWGQQCESIKNFVVIPTAGDHMYIQSNPESITTYINDVVSPNVTLKRSEDPNVLMQ